MNSVIITIMTLALQLIVIILASFALGKLRPWGSGFIEILFCPDCLSHLKCSQSPTLRR